MPIAHVHVGVVHGHGLQTIQALGDLLDPIALHQIGQHERRATMRTLRLSLGDPSLETRTKISANDEDANDLYPNAIVTAEFGTAWTDACVVHIAHANTAAQEIADALNHASRSANPRHLWECNCIRAIRLQDAEAIKSSGQIRFNGKT